MVSWREQRVFSDLSPCPIGVAAGHDLAILEAVRESAGSPYRGRDAEFSGTPSSLPVLGPLGLICQPVAEVPRVGRLRLGRDLGFRELHP
jgi:hypothetical protein